MPATGFDQNAGHWLNGKPLAIQFNFSLAFEHNIDLAHFLMIMRARVCRDIHAVHTGRSAWSFGKGAPRRAARTGLRGYFIELSNGKIRHDQFLSSSKA